MMESQIKRGRPLVRIHVNGMICTCFVDTGSEVTLIKESTLNKLNILSVTPVGRTFKGASGAIFSGLGEINVNFSIEDAVKCNHPVMVFKDISFPGDVLLGIDFIRLFNFQFVANLTPPRNYMSFNDVKVPFWFSDQSSLGLRVLNINKFSQSVLCVSQSVICQPKSGCFVSTTVTNDFNNPVGLVQGRTARVLVPRSIISINNNSASVWVINDKPHRVTLKEGMKLASINMVSDVYANSNSVHLPEEVEQSEPMAVDDFTDFAD